MNKIHLLLLAASARWLQQPAQDTNSLKTDLGVFETQTGTVLIKGFSQIGTLTVGTDVVSVYAKESSDITTATRPMVWPL